MKNALRLVDKSARPLGPLTLAEKRAKAIAWLRARNLYLLDKGSKQPGWRACNQDGESA